VAPSARRSVLNPAGETPPPCQLQAPPVDGSRQGSIHEAYQTARLVGVDQDIPGIQFGMALGKLRLKDFGVCLQSSGFT
jgi:hypothetical protein